MFSCGTKPLKTAPEALKRNKLIRNIRRYKWGTKAECKTENALRALRNIL